MTADHEDVTTDAELIDRIGIDRISEALGKDPTAIRVWRNKPGIPRALRAAVEALDPLNTPAPASSTMPAGPAEDEDLTSTVLIQNRRRPSGPSQPVDNSAYAPHQDNPGETITRPQQQHQQSVRLNRHTVTAACAVCVLALTLGIAQGLPAITGSAYDIPATTEAKVESIPAAISIPSYSYTDLPTRRAPEVVSSPEPALTQAALTVAEAPPPVVQASPPKRIQTAAPRATKPTIDPDELRALESGLVPPGAAISSAAPAGGSRSDGIREARAAIDRIRDSLPGQLSPPSQVAPLARSREEAFLESEVTGPGYLRSGLQPPRSAYEVKAGAIIPAALLTGLNSDLPGDAIAQVTENVYDTATGYHLLIPQGTKVIGRYNSEIGFAQNSAQVVWDRLIMPNGNSIALESMVGTDKAGYAGLTDEVDYHFGALFGAVILSSFISVGANLATDSGNEVADALGDAAAQQAAQVGAQIVDRQLNVQPTITIRPGFKLNILVDQDMILQPYTS